MNNIFGAKKCALQARKQRMQKEQKVSEQDVDAVWGNANFGNMPRMEVVRQGILKTACGYHHGHTSTHILRDLGLITANNRLTRKGQHNLFEFYGKGHTL